MESQSSSLTSVYRQMLTIRVVEENLLDLFSKGLLRGTVHTCIGQEGCAVGIVEALDRHRDVICSNHRGHGHFLAYCNDIQGLIAEIMGKPSGVCGGLGGSQHLHVRNFYSNGILGGMVPVSTGMALAEKHRGTGAVTVVFLGDGAFGEGVVYESINISSLWNLPILFAVEHNQYAQSTPTCRQHAGLLETRGASFGLKVNEVDGNDVLAVLEIATRVVEEIRLTNRPQIVFMRTYRLAAHSKGDDLRNSEEIETNKKRDPLLILSQKLDKAEVSAIEQEIRETVSACVSALL
jgi:TPP-dependent pyruvate/acetoin dehydrogenase alpha subunit